MPLIATEASLSLSESFLMALAGRGGEHTHSEFGEFGHFKKTRSKNMKNFF